MRPAAFFDLDHTLVVGTSAEKLFVRRLIAAGVVGPVDVLRWFIRLAREPKLSHGFFRRNKSYLAGKEVGRVIPLAREAARVAAVRISPVGRERVLQHKAAGRLTVLVTGTLEILARPIAGELQIDQVISTVVPASNGRLTGEVSGLYPRGANKRLLMEGLAEREGLDLAASFAYGDSLADLPMLEAVGHPVAVNPSRGLLREARRRGWPVESFGGAANRSNTNPKAVKVIK
jgi:HAD superfamily hydrolase (TIGR01490 family)